MNSKNVTIQGLMGEIERIDDKDPELEIKLRIIAEKIAVERQRMSTDPVSSALLNDDRLADPADAFACEGCQ
jgi:preprotein translocase subunit YajC